MRDWDAICVGALRKGVLYKQGGSRKSWKKRQFVLKGDKLMYYKPGAYEKPAGIIDLSECSMINALSEKEIGQPFAFNVVVSTRTYNFYANDEVEMQNWINELSTASRRSSKNFNGEDNRPKHSSAPALARLNSGQMFAVGSSSSNSFASSRETASPKLLSSGGESNGSAGNSPFATSHFSASPASGVSPILIGNFNNGSGIHLAGVAASPSVSPGSTSPSLQPGSGNLAARGLSPTGEDNDHAATLFRANSIASKMMSCFGKLVASQYMIRTLRDVLEDFVSSPLPMEVNPSKLGKNGADDSNSGGIAGDEARSGASSPVSAAHQEDCDPHFRASGGINASTMHTHLHTGSMHQEDLKENRRNLQNACEAILNAIFNSTKDAPDNLRLLCFNLREEISDVFPNLSLKMVGIFLFLRLFCPAIVMPQQYGILHSSVQLNNELKRALLLTSKIIQNIVNGVEFGSKELFMEPFNTFVRSQMARLEIFLDTFATVPSSFTAERIDHSKVDIWASFSVKSIIPKSHNILPPQASPHSPAAAAAAASSGSFSATSMSASAAVASAARVSDLANYKDIESGLKVLSDTVEKLIYATDEDEPSDEMEALKEALNEYDEGNRTPLINMLVDDLDIVCELFIVTPLSRADQLVSALVHVFHHQREAHKLLRFVISREANREALVTAVESGTISNVSKGFGSTVKQGYLQKANPKKDVSLMRKRRWFVLKERGQLLYYKNVGSDLPLGQIDVNAHCSINESLELARMHGFELVNRQRTFRLFASNADERDAWLQAMTTVRLNNASGNSSGAASKNFTRRSLSKQPGSNVALSGASNGASDASSPTLNSTSASGAAAAAVLTAGPLHPYAERRKSQPKSLSQLIHGQVALTKPVPTAATAPLAKNTIPVQEEDDEIDPMDVISSYTSVRRPSESGTGTISPFPSRSPYANISEGPPPTPPPLSSLPKTSSSSNSPLPTANAPMASKFLPPAPLSSNLVAMNLLLNTLGSPSTPPPPAPASLLSMSTVPAPVSYKPSHAPSGPSVAYGKEPSLPPSSAPSVAHALALGSISSAPPPPASNPKTLSTSFTEILSAFNAGAAAPVRSNPSLPILSEARDEENRAAVTESHYTLLNATPKNEISPPLSDDYSLDTVLSQLQSHQISHQNASRNNAASAADTTDHSVENNVSSDNSFYGNDPVTNHSNNGVNNLSHGNAHSSSGFSGGARNEMVNEYALPTVRSNTTLSSTSSSPSSSLSKSGHQLYDVPTDSLNLSNSSAFASAGSTKGPLPPKSVSSIPSAPISSLKNVCAHCQLEITPSQLSLIALGKSWHAEHFCCAECHTPITGNYYPKDNLPYCLGDYKKLFSAFCHGCQLEIEGAITSAGGFKWHPDCFKCCRCSKLLTMFSHKDGKFYCPPGTCDMPEGDASDSQKCSSCNLALVKDFLVALNKKWHTECLRCFKCQDSLVSVKFYEFEGQPYCWRDYSIAQGHVCERCKQPIEGDAITAVEKKFHKHCFICMDPRCDTNLASSQFFVVMGELYCAVHGPTAYSLYHQ